MTHAREQRVNYHVDHFFPTWKFYFYKKKKTIVRKFYRRSRRFIRYGSRRSSELGWFFGACGFVLSKRRTLATDRPWGYAKRFGRAGGRSGRQGHRPPITSAQFLVVAMHKNLDEPNRDAPVASLALRARQKSLQDPWKIMKRCETLG